jgi:uncharacterized membrane protein YcaP (DUF421 family)
LYIASLLAMRAMGKREVGQLMPFELVVVIMIAELAATPMGGVGIPLLYGLLPMVALVVCHGLITAVCMKWQPFRAWMSGQPTVLMRNGVICEKQMRKSSMDLNDLMEAIRTAGILDPAEVGTVILEPSGQVNVFPKADFRSVSPDDLRLTVSREGLPLPLVMDGVIQQYKKRMILDQLDHIDPSRIFVTSTLPRDKAEALAEEIRQLGYFKEVLVEFAGATISSHCGPNTIGYLTIHKS